MHVEFIHNGLYLIEGLHILHNKITLNQIVLILFQCTIDAGQNPFNIHHWLFFIYAKQIRQIPAALGNHRLWYEVCIFTMNFSYQVIDSCAANHNCIRMRRQHLNILIEIRQFPLKLLLAMFQIGQIRQKRSDRTLSDRHTHSNVDRLEHLRHGVEHRIDIFFLGQDNCRIYSIADVKFVFGNKLLQHRSDNKPLTGA